MRQHCRGGSGPPSGVLPHAPIHCWHPTPLQVFWRSRGRRPRRRPELHSGAADQAITP